jgi:hypothetical protein
LKYNKKSIREYHFPIFLQYLIKFDLYFNGLNQYNLDHHDRFLHLDHLYFLLLGQANVFHFCLKLISFFWFSLFVFYHLNIFFDLNFIRKTITFYFHKKFLFSFLNLHSLILFVHHETVKIFYDFQSLKKSYFQKDVHHHPLFLFLHQLDHYLEE